MRFGLRGVATAAFALVPALVAGQSPPAERARAELLKTDVEFSETAQKLGIAEAFVKYADPGATMLPANEHAVTGADGIRKQFAAMRAGTTLEWKPYKAEAAASGDLGYTLGTYEMRSTGDDGSPVVRYGKYCSVWKKQKDGRWKWVVDVGTPSPPPK
jgi:ketosteroid isomerase-like protein